MQQETFMSNNSNAFDPLNLLNTKFLRNRLIKNVIQIIFFVITVYVLWVFLVLHFILSVFVKYGSFNIITN